MTFDVFFKEKSFFHLHEFKAPRKDYFQDTMVIHHLGIACKDMNETLDYLRKAYKVSSTSDRVFDSNQNVDLMMVYFENGTPIELISGNTVEQLLKKNIKLYHICYEVKNIENKIEEFIQMGATLVSPLKPAILFLERRVAFLSTLLGFVELLES